MVRAHRVDLSLLHRVETLQGRADHILGTEGAQRRLYNELRAYYRDSLLRAVDSRGLAKSKIQVLEALLRLRQAACHAGLLDALSKPGVAAFVGISRGHRKAESPAGALTTPS